MNVLLTCAGRRTHTVAIFKEALHGSGQVFACDTDPDAPALREADVALVVPSVGEPEYLPALLALCAAHRIGLVIPALEPELPLLAEAREQFAADGTLVLVSSPQIVATCFDKLATAQFLARHGLAAPRTFVSLAEARRSLAAGEVKFPLVVKPRWGVGSLAVEFPENDEELELAFRLARIRLGRSFLAEISATDAERCVLIQEKLAGCEYGLDVINDLDGRHVTTFIKRKLRMRAGQTDRATTVSDERLAQIGRQIGQNLRHTGLLDCDVFVTGDACCVVDLNPRIGGGYPFAHLAGADFPSALLAWARREKADPRCFSIAPGVSASRGDFFIITDPAEGEGLRGSALALNEQTFSP